MCGTLSVDDSVPDKPYSQYLAFVGHFWSGKHKRSVKGINLITLYYTGTKGQHLPVNFRVYDKSEGKAKNDHFRDMPEEVLAWGLEPAFVTGDSWYSGADNLKRVKNHALEWLFAIESNRTVSVDKGQWTQVQKLDIPDDGQLAAVGRRTFTEQHDKHWHIEQHHRAIKQVCNIENFQVRSKTAIRNHLAAMYSSRNSAPCPLMDNCYSVQRNLFNGVIAGFIGTLMPTMAHLNPEFQAVVNA